MTDRSGRHASPTSRSPRSWWAWLVADPRRTDVAIAVVTTAFSLTLVLGSPEEYDAGWPEWAAGVGAFVLILLRRRWPFQLLAVSLAWTTVHTAIWERPSSMVFATLVLLATACVRLERGRAIALGAVVGLILYGVAFTIGNDLEYGDDRAVIALVWTAAAVGIADAVRSWRRYRESVDARVAAAVQAAEAEAGRQVTEERLAIARELHDLLAHSLSVMNVQTGAALHLLRTDPDQAEASLTTARDAGRSVLDELGELLAVLRDDRLDSDEGRAGDHAGADHADPSAPLTSLPTFDDLPRLVDATRSAGLTVTWTDAGEPDALAPATSLAAYRITQEALTNAARHGNGSATLQVVWSTEHLDITVTNPLRSHPDGAAGRRPEHPVTGGHGLVGMRERAAANGGTLDAGPAPGGFVVHARLPVGHHHRHHDDRRRP